MRNRRYQQEDGVALITAMLAVLILSGMATVFVARALTEQRASGSSQQFETTIHTAEAAGDAQIRELNLNDDHSTVDRVGAEVTMDAADRADEAAWAIGLLDEMEMRDSPAWVTTERGESYAVRPKDAATGDLLDVIYAVGATPSFTAPNATVRVVKMQVSQDSYTPRFALLGGGNFKLGGSSNIRSPECASAGVCIADVHLNGQVEGEPGRGSIEGQLRVAGGSCNGFAEPNVTEGCVDDGVQPQPVPEIRAENFYSRNSSSLNPDPGGQSPEWWDLCVSPDGTNGLVKRPAAEPCTGAVVWDQALASTSNFLGWDFRSGQRTWRASSLKAGVFYVYEANAYVTGTEGRRAVSILVDQGGATAQQAGSLSIQGNPQMEAALPSILFITDRDLKFGGASTAGDCLPGTRSLGGFIGVAEQFDPGGGVDLRGAIVEEDRENESTLVNRNRSSAGGMCLEYDNNLAVDLTGIWVVTFWNEL